MLIQNGLVFTENGIFEKLDIRVSSDHRITELSPGLSASGGEETVNAEGMRVIPGLVDIHSHGAVGHDFCDADVGGLNAILAYEKSVGVTSYCPTSMTYPEEKLSNIFRTVNEAATGDEYARILGINMEGPFISPGKVGAQNPAYVQSCDAGMFRRLSEECGGKILLTTVAPEEPGAMDFIREMKDAVHLSVGHTCADYDEADDAFSAGADHVTHLMNAMPAFLHRDPGVIGAAFDHKNVYVELIADLIHIHPAMIRSVFELFGPDRVCLISDSMEATGMADGDYELGGQKVIKRGSHATLEDGTLAGSVTNVFDCMKNVVSIGIPMEHAILAATRNPAQSVGMEDAAGRIQVGREADLVLVDDALNLIRVL